MSEVSLQWGYIGIGQGGCRIAQSFYSLGYTDCVFINTARVDLDGLDVPSELKLLISESGDGAGKDPSVAEEAVSKFKEEIVEMVKRLSDCDQVFVCTGAGGGTGSGAAIPVLEIAKLCLPSIPVGLISSMPAVHELVSDATRRNAKSLLDVCCDLADSGELTPFIVIDNELVKRRVRPKSLRRLWVDGNLAFADILHNINRLSSTPTMLVSLDKADLKTLMFRRGTLFVGSREINNPQDRVLVARHLDLAFNSGTVLHSDSPLDESDCALVLTMPSRILDADISFFDLFTGVVNNCLKSMPNSHIHRGIYEDESSKLIRATVLGIGEKSPRSKILARLK